MNFPAPRKRQATWRQHDEIRRSICGNCPVGCGVKGFLSNSELIDLFGDEEHSANKGSFCPKGLLSWILLHHPQRHLRPRMRKILQEPFKETSWDEALAFIATQISTRVPMHGANSIIVHADETSPFGHTFGGDRFARAIGTPNGPGRFHSRASGPEGRIADIFGVGADRLLMNSQRDWANSRCILVVGSDPGASDPVTLGPLVDVRDRGGSLIVIDSKTTITAVKASYFVRVKPGTEAIFLAGVCNQLIENGWIDEEFIDLTTIGFDRFRASMSGFKNERVASDCGVSQEDIWTVAKAIGLAHPVQVMGGDWSSRERLTDDLLGLCAAIVSLRGSVGIPGGGLNLLNASPFIKFGDTPPLYVEELILREDPVSAIFFHGNPLSRLAGGAELRERLSRVPLVVQLGGFDDETAAQAHVQLPLTTWLEESGLVTHSNGRTVQWRERVVEPRGESRAALDIWADIAAACRINLADIGPDRGSKLARKAADMALRKNSFTTAISVAKLESHEVQPGGILWPCTRPEDIVYEDDRFIRGDVRGRNILFRRNQKFPGSDARFANGIDRVDLGRTVFEPAAESPRGGGTADSSLKLKMIATVAVDYIPTWSGAAPTPSRKPMPTVVRLHPHTANACGVRSGSPVTVSNAHGSFTGRADLSLTVAPDVVWCIATPGFVGQLIGPFALFDVPKNGNARFPYANVDISPA